MFETPWNIQDSTRDSMKYAKPVYSFYEISKILRFFEHSEFRRTRRLNFSMFAICY